MRWLGASKVQMPKNRAAVTSALSSREYEEDGFTVTGGQVGWRGVHVRSHKVALMTCVCREV